MKRRWPYPVLASLVLVAVWFAIRPRPGVDFVGPRPNIDFIPAADLKQKPWFDFKLPTGKRIAYPLPFQTERPVYGLDAVAGFIQFEDSREMLANVHFESLEHEAYTSPLAWIKHDGPVGTATTSPLPPSFGTPAASTPYQPNVKAIYGLPFATDPAYRDADLVYGGNRYRLKLPVTREFGPAVRKPSRTLVGDLELRAIPRPWKATTSYFNLDLYVDGPRDSTYFVECVLQSQSAFVRRGEPMQITLSHLDSPKLEGISITETQSFETTITVIAVDSGGLVLQAKDGSHFRLSSTRNRFPDGILALGIGTSRFFGKWESREIPDFKVGERLEGTLYRVAKEYRTSIPVDIPPLLTEPFMRYR